jgi:hypothetical protein
MAMSAEGLVREVYRKATGELDPSVVPGTEDGATILSVINEAVESYHNALGEYGERIVWARNIDPAYTVATTEDGTTDYEVDWDEVSSVLDGFYTKGSLVAADGTQEPFDLVPFWQLHDSRQGTGTRCSVTAEGLTFADAPQPGLDIVVPVSLRGRSLKGDEKDVEEATGVHNLLWLATAAAAEYVRTDVVRGAQYPNVLAQANDVWRRMLADNEARTAALLHGAVPQAYGEGWGYW